MKRLTALISVLAIVLSQSAVYARTQGHFSYVYSVNSNGVSKEENGYAFYNDDGSVIYMDNNGNYTENKVHVTGANVYGSDDGTEVYVYDNSFNWIGTYNTAEYEVFENDNVITVIGDGIITVFSAENGEILSTLAADEYYYTPESHWISFNSSGVRSYVNKDGLCGLIDLYGNIVLEPKYNEIIRAGEFIKAKLGDMWSILDAIGNHLHDFSGYTQIDVADFGFDGDAYHFRAGYIGSNKKDLYDADFELIAEPEGIEFSYQIPESELIVFYNEDMTGEYGLIKKDGTIVFPDKYSIEYLGNGIIQLWDNWKYTLVNTNGEIIVQNMDYVTDMGDNGLIGVSVTGEYERYIDTSGNVKIELSDGWCVQTAFSEGKAGVVRDIVYSRYGECAYIDEKGELTILPAKEGMALTGVWCMTSPFENDYAIIGAQLEKSGPTKTLLIKYTAGSPSAWAEETVDAAIADGIVPKSLQDQYLDDITREEFSELAYETMSKLYEMPTVEFSFSDTDSEKVASLAELGIIYGKSETEFAPKDLITREEAATILYRMAGVLGIPITQQYVEYRDNAEISGWAISAVYAMRNADIMNGTGNNNFSPADTYTIEQAITTMYRVFKLSHLTE